MSVANTNIQSIKTIPGPSFSRKLKKDFRRNKYLYLMAIPIIAYYIIFHYKPMYGAVIAFKEFSPIKGIMGSPWIGFKHFYDFFTDYYFLRIVKNTIIISFSSLIFGFPAPIILALLINELKNKVFTRTVQTITYMPHFISLVVICGLIRSFTADDGIITYVFSLFGGEKVSMLNRPELFVPIYIISGIWQGVGWGSIIYLSALQSIDVQLYEAATIDGAGHLRQTWHITLPGITPMIVLMLILRIGGLMSVGYEKIILLYNPAIYGTSDVISSYVYRRGLLEFNWSYSSAVGLFNSVINFILLIMANKISRKVNETSLW
ncbi:MAG: ABC transporter permease subunit [Clostridiaceae bacterium]